MGQRVDSFCAADGVVVCERVGGGVSHCVCGPVRFCVGVGVRVDERRGERARDVDGGDVCGGDDVGCGIGDVFVDSVRRVDLLGVGDRDIHCIVYGELCGIVERDGGAVEQRDG